MQLQNPFDIFTLPFRGAYESAKDLITPKSQAEALVDEIYSPENRGMVLVEAESFYDPESAAQPQVFVEAKQSITRAAKSATNAISSTIKKYLIIGGIILLVLVFVYGLAGGLARR